MRTPAICILALIAASLSNPASAQTDPSAPAVPDFQAAMQQLGTLMGGGTNAAAAVVGYRQLKTLLPADLAGMKRTSASGEKSGAFGMTVSFAEGVYEGEDGSRIQIKISDLGGMGGMMAFAQAGWTMTEIDRETDDGFERTYTFKGNKAHEQYDSVNKSGEFQAIVNGKFSIEISGSQTTMEAINAARDRLDLAAIGQLTPETEPSE